MQFCVIPNKGDGWKLKESLEQPNLRVLVGEGRVPETGPCSRLQGLSESSPSFPEVLERLLQCHNISDLDIMDSHEHHGFVEDNDPRELEHAGELEEDHTVSNSFPEALTNYGEIKAQLVAKDPTTNNGAPAAAKSEEAAGSDQNPQHAQVAIIGWKQTRHNAEKPTTTGAFFSEQLVAELSSIPLIKFRLLEPSTQFEIGYWTNEEADVQKQLENPDEPREVLQKVPEVHPSEAEIKIQDEANPNDLPSAYMGLDPEPEVYSPGLNPEAEAFNPGLSHEAEAFNPGLSPEAEAYNSGFQYHVESNAGAYNVGLGPRPFMITTQHIYYYANPTLPGQPTPGQFAPPQILIPHHQQFPNVRFAFRSGSSTRFQNPGFAQNISGARFVPGNVQRSQFPRNINKLRPCQFCKRNGEAYEVYGSHELHIRDSNIVSCPVLRKFVCKRCGVSGDYAHTDKYCPWNQNPHNADVTRTPLQSDGTPNKKLFQRGPFDRRR